MQQHPREVGFNTVAAEMRQWARCGCCSRRDRGAREVAAAGSWGSAGSTAPWARCTALTASSRAEHPPPPAPLHLRGFGLSRQASPARCPTGGSGASAAAAPLQSPLQRGTVSSACTERGGAAGVPVGQRRAAARGQGWSRAPALFGGAGSAGAASSLV